MRTACFAIVLLSVTLTALADTPPPATSPPPAPAPTPAPAPPAPAAAEREISWHSFEGGGILLTDGNPGGLSFAGTAGQPEVGTMVALDADSDLSFVSGFWAGGGDELCAGDFNGDGALTPDDLSDFITCYFEFPPCGSADVTIDGEVNPDDLSDYINAYFGGCA